MRYSLISRISLAAPRQNKMAGRGAVSALTERRGGRGRSPKLPRVAVRHAIALIRREVVPPPPSVRQPVIPTRGARRQMQARRDIPSKGYKITTHYGICCQIDK